LLDIGAALGKHHASVLVWVRASGGFSPPNRRRRVGALTIEEREEISRGIAREQSFRQIAARLQRPVSTISREVARHGGRDRYRALEAEAVARERAGRPKACKLATHARLQQCVAFKLTQNWSPEQISAWLKLRYPDDDRMRISHESIYRSLYVQARGVLKKELQAHLRTRRKMRRSKRATSKGQLRGQIVDAVSISERPPEVEDRAIPGHWEGDLISGSRNSHIATLVERHSRYVMLVKVAGKDTDSVVTALKKQVVKLPSELRKSLTWDRGTELAAHKDFTVSTDVAVYFCDPHSPWQRGSNENTNGLLRQYFPDGTDLSSHSQAELNRVARQLNERPRKTLGFRTPADTLNEAVALTG
jgi:IS30 family transposase